MKKKSLLLSIICAICGLNGWSQVNLQRSTDNLFFNSLSVGKGDQTNTSNSAWIEVGKLGTTRGFLPPRTTTSSINTPAYGVLILNTSDTTFKFYDGLVWRPIIDSVRLQYIINNQLPPPLTFYNGLNRTGSNVGLGGTLTQATTVDASTFQLKFVNNLGAIAFANNSNTYSSGILYQMSKNALPNFYNGFYSNGTGTGYYLGANLGINSLGNYFQDSVNNFGMAFLFNTVQANSYKMKIVGYDHSGGVNDSVLTVRQNGNILINTKQDLGFKLSVKDGARIMGNVRLDSMANRNDSSTTKALYVDNQGNLKYGGINAAKILTCVDTPFVIAFQVGISGGVASNTSVYSDFNLIGKRVNVYREGHHQSINGTDGISYDNVTGKIRFFPVLNYGEQVYIESFCVPGYGGTRIIKTEDGRSILTEDGRVIFTQ